jgi:hypothetical protein
MAFICKQKRDKEMTEEIIKKELEKLYDILFCLCVGKPMYSITFHVVWPSFDREPYDCEIADEEILTLYESIITRKINTLEEILTKIKG